MLSHNRKYVMLLASPGTAGRGAVGGQGVCYNEMGIMRNFTNKPRRKTACISKLLLEGPNRGRVFDTCVMDKFHGV